MNTSKVLAGMRDKMTQGVLNQTVVQMRVVDLLTNSLEVTGLQGKNELVCLIRRDIKRSVKRQKLSNN
jgi:hypothetical protein